jgi:hypothetical protein
MITIDFDHGYHTAFDYDEIGLNTPVTIATAHKDW